ncbi:MAG: precorrin-6y C5,15-methyltransferase (decarboxylating) subunit CbiE [Trichlorobacter sp.]|nr:precorrin-6y C5,15-methyltransferase (decarboxylating) subunit CbiE [Trichlorobacter sp.]
MKKPAISLIGMGVGGLDGLSARAFTAINESDLLIGHSRHLELFAEYTGEKRLLGRLPELVQLLETTDRKTAVLASGDPLYFGVGRYLLQRLPKERITVFSNVSSVQYAFSLIKEPWDDALVLSVHGRDLSAVLDQIMQAAKVCLLTDYKNSPKVIAKAILQRTANDYTVWICEDLGMDKERCTCTTLQELAGYNSSALNILILQRAV